MELKGNTKIHHGNNIRRYREIRKVSQEALAMDMGVSQQIISTLEKKNEIDDETLSKVAKSLQLPVWLFKEMTDDNHINIFNNTFNDSSSVVNINPVDKVIEIYEHLLEKERNKNK